MGQMNNMCLCTPENRTPFCGVYGCDWPSDEGTKGKIENNGKDIHVMPNNGKHSESLFCFCMPKIIYTDEFTKINVITHKSDEELNQ